MDPKKSQTDAKERCQYPSPTDKGLAFATCVQCLLSLSRRVLSPVVFSLLLLLSLWFSLPIQLQAQDQLMSVEESSQHAVAQPEALPKVAKRPRIGLALSGGGARGLSHIGVLKVLDRLRIPVDCISGTSMGAIIGGARATGLPVPFLEELAKKTDWQDLFRDNPPRKEQSIRNKEENNLSLISPTIHFDGWKPDLPLGAIEGTAISGFLREATASAIEIHDFNKLPIPFRAVSTDLATGKAFVLQSGNLATAIRASMSVPGVFTPVKIGDHLLIDGGAVDNLPIDVARQICADVVIAVAIDSPLHPLDSLTSPVSVLTQTALIAGLQNINVQLASLKPSDILIRPELGHISAVSFGSTNEAIAAGELATQALAARLLPYQLSEEAYQAEVRSKDRLPPTSIGPIAELRFEGLKHVNPEAFASYIPFAPGKCINLACLEKGIRRIYGRGDFSALTYLIDESADGAELVISGEESGSTRLRFGVNIAYNLGDDATLGLLATARKTLLNRYGGEWYSTVMLGQNSEVHTEIYQPLNPEQTLFLSPYASLSRRSRPLYLPDDLSILWRLDDAQLGLDFGAPLGTIGEWRIGSFLRRSKVAPLTAYETSPVLVGPPFSELGLHANLTVDQLDRPVFPTQGFLGTIDFQRNFFLSSSRMLEPWLGESEHSRVKLRLTNSFHRGEHVLTASLSAGARWGGRGHTLSETDIRDGFFLGGPLALSGYPLNRFLGSRGVGLAQLMYYKQIFTLPSPFGQGVYVGALAEAAVIYGDAQKLLTYDNDPLSPTKAGSLSAFIGADTSLGPAYLGVGLNIEGALQGYLFVGAPPN